MDPQPRITVHNPLNHLLDVVVLPFGRYCVLEQERSRKTKDVEAQS